MDERAGQRQPQVGGGTAAVAAPVAAVASVAALPQHDALAEVSQQVLASCVEQQLPAAAGCAMPESRLASRLASWLTSWLVVPVGVIALTPSLMVVDVPVE